jgi:hypothetical protein
MYDEHHMDSMQSGAWCFPILAGIVKDKKILMKSMFMLSLNLEKKSAKKDLMIIVKAGSSSL